MAEKEKNFVSAVIYLGDEREYAAPFIETLCGQLGTRFAQYELVFVEDASRDGTLAAVRECIEQMQAPPSVTIIHMSLRQGRELAMNAGQDIAIGDFVYEFDTMRMPYPAEYILKAYEACLAGNDIVSVSPTHNRNLFSGLFYYMFNSASGSKYKLQTDVFRLLSRRAINRVHAISAAAPYRKATYAASGLRLEVLKFERRAGHIREERRVSRAVDSLALYTSLGYKISISIAIVMLILMLAGLVYTVAVYATLGAGAIQAGWTTMMLLSTGGFFGVFIILAIVLKYLSLLVELVFKKQRYLVESVEKLV